MRADEEGFLYPHIDEETCIHCGLCVKVCQIFQKQADENRIPAEAFACVNPCGEDRMASSSGGVFILLARYVISRGGYVFGAAFDEHMELAHACASTMEGCRAFMGSKYLQSRIGTSFSEAKQLLDAGKWVLFTGTPCQIHGLKLFLRKDYDTLLTADLACHGVPSPAVFRAYLRDLERGQRSGVAGFHFRSKRTGWKRYSVEAEFEDGTIESERQGDCPYMKGFLSDLYLRPHCYQCRNKGENRYADLTMGDYWGVEKKEPDFDDDRGTSVILTGTEKGKAVLAEIGAHLRMKKTDLDYVLRMNPSLARPVRANPRRQDFFSDFISEPDHLEKRLRPYLPRLSLRKRIKAALRSSVKQALKRMASGGKRG